MCGQPLRKPRIGGEKKFYTAARTSTQSAGTRLQGSCPASHCLVDSRRCNKIGVERTAKNAISRDAAAKVQSSVLDTPDTTQNIAYLTCPLPVHVTPYAAQGSDNEFQPLRPPQDGPPVLEYSADRADTSAAEGDVNADKPL